MKRRIRVIALMIVVFSLTSAVNADEIGELREMIRKQMDRFPDKNLTILCGHTHGEGEARISDNIFVKTGGARYQYPEVQKIITIST